MKEAMHILLRLLVMGLFLWFFFFKLLYIGQAADNDMYPAIRAKDLIVGFRMPGSPKKDDVVVYKNGTSVKLGRVIGKAGDTIVLDDSGHVFVNGTRQGKYELYKTYATPKETYPLTVCEDSIYVLGDYRIQATDSRRLGQIANDQIKAKVIMILRRQAI